MTAFELNSSTSSSSRGSLVPTRSPTAGIASVSTSSTALGRVYITNRKDPSNPTSISRIATEVESCRLPECQVAANSPDEPSASNESVRRCYFAGDGGVGRGWSEL
jgi:hypothetical protein